MANSNNSRGLTDGWHLDSGTGTVISEMNANNPEMIFVGNSVMAGFMRSLNWSQTTLGAIDRWPPNLKTALSILLNTDCPMFLVWGSDRILLYNDACFALLKPQLNDSHALILCGQSLNQSCVKPWQVVRSTIDQVFATGQPLQRQNGLLPADQDHHCREHFNWSYSPLWHETGKISGVFATGCKNNTQASEVQASETMVTGGVAVEIAEPQQNEAGWQGREEELRLVTNALPVPIAYINKDQQYCFNNQAYETWVGQPVNVLRGKHMQEVLGKFAYETVRPYIEQALAGQQVNFESQMLYRGGTTRYISAEYVPHINEQGEVEGFVSLVRDIGDRKKVEAALRCSEERLRVALQNAPISVFNQDRELKYTWVHNPILSDPQGMLGKSDRDFLLPGDVEPITAIKQRVLETGIGAREKIKITKDRTNHYDITVEPLYDSNHAIVGITCAAIDISELKQAEIDLRESEERLRLAMEGAQMATWDVDLITGKAIWSELHFTMLGYEPSPTGEATEAMWSSRIHPDDMAQVAQEWQQSRQDCRLYQTEYRVIRADNQQIAWLAGLGNFTYGQSGEPVRSVGVLFDITQRKQAELMLIEQKRLLELIVTGHSLDKCLAAICTSVSRLNPHTRACILLTDAQQQSLLCLIAPDFPSSLSQELKDAPMHDLAIITRGASVDADESITCVDVVNDDRWSSKWRDSCISHGILAFHSVPVVGSDGLFCGVLMLCFNEARLPTDWEYQFANFGNRIASLVFERDRSSLALRESEARFRNMADHAPFMVWVTDPTGCCTYLSESWYDFSGQTPATGLGFGWLDAVHPDDRDNSKNMFLAANKRREAFRLEYRLRRKDGEYIWAIDAAAPWFGEAGQYQGYVGSVIDISDRKQAEAEREQLLSREQAAREAAESANRIKDEFLAVLSHELRSPLNPILGWSRLLQTGRLDEAKTKQALMTIERNAKLQAELIEDLLDVSRILQGKLSLNINAVNLASTIQAAIETVRLAAEAKSIDLQFTTGDFGSNNEPQNPKSKIQNPEFIVSGDSTRLQQMVWNLLSNAVKFTPAHGRVEVRLQCVEQQAQITISDSGKGISAQFLPHVFDYFRQADSATTRKFGGLGLGLAIVRYLVELHGGTIRADSPGEELGATFTVSLPLMPAQAAVSQSPVFPSQSLDLNDVEVLVVDDDRDTREFVEFLLNQVGARVVTAASAREALAALMSTKPYVLLSDIGMPDMDGYMLMRQIRKLPPEQGGSIPAIALTAYAAEIDYQQAIDAGFQQHIAKPIEPDELIRIIVEILNRT